MTEDLKEMVSMRAWAQEFTKTVTRRVAHKRRVVGDQDVTHWVQSEELEEDGKPEVEIRYDVLLSLSGGEAQLLANILFDARRDCREAYSKDMAAAAYAALDKAIADLGKANINPPQSNDLTYNSPVQDALRDFADGKISEKELWARVPSFNGSLR